jgi:cyclophilin family peptidyl-prolyl cis-trans isomerase
MTKLILAGLAAVLLLTAQVTAQTAANPKVLLKTSKGNITLELFPAKAPVTVKNFLSYVNDKFYNGTIFHRVIKGFMIQGGGLTEDMHQKAARPPIKNEAANGLKNVRGAVAMARSAVVDSATCQFFINLVDNPNLDHRDNTEEGFGYCVFGRVVAGMDVVDAIAESPTGTRRGHRDVPREPVVIISAEVVTDR